jgi:hypothetical protein
MLLDGLVDEEMEEEIDSLTLLLIEDEREEEMLSDSDGLILSLGLTL